MVKPARSIILHLPYNAIVRIGSLIIEILTLQDNEWLIQNIVA